MAMKPAPTLQRPAPAIHPTPRRRPGHRLTLAAEGFSLAEVLVAGLVIVGVVIASARLVSSSLAGGQQTARRQQVEAEIARDLDALRQQDQTLQSQTALELGASTTAIPSACSSPAASLKQRVDAALPTQGGSSGLWTRQTSTNANGLLQVTYSLQLPNQSGGETRVVELTPAIAGPCLERTLGLG